MISDDFIEDVITPKPEQDNTMEISRKLYGMEAVAQFNDELLDAQAKARGQERDGGDNE